MDSVGAPRTLFPTDTLKFKVSLNENTWDYYVFYFLLRSRRKRLCFFHAVSGNKLCSSGDWKRVTNDLTIAEERFSFPHMIVLAVVCDSCIDVYMSTSWNVTCPKHSGGGTVMLILEHWLTTSSPPALSLDSHISRTMRADVVASKSSPWLLNNM